MGGHRPGQDHRVSGLHDWRTASILVRQWIFGVKADETLPDPADTRSRGGIDVPKKQLPEETRKAFASLKKSPKIKPHAERAEEAMLTIRNTDIYPDSWNPSDESQPYNTGEELLEKAQTIEKAAHETYKELEHIANEVFFTPPKEDYESGKVLTFKKIKELKALNPNCERAKQEIKKMKERCKIFYVPETEPQWKKRTIKNFTDHINILKGFKEKGEHDSPLPPGWERKWSESRGCYGYCNRTTGVRQWEHPGLDKDDKQLRVLDDLHENFMAKLMGFAVKYEWDPVKYPRMSWQSTKVSPSGGGAGASVSGNNSAGQQLKKRYAKIKQESSQSRRLPRVPPRPRNLRRKVAKNNRERQNDRKRTANRTQRLENMRRSNPDLFKLQRKR